MIHTRTTKRYRVKTPGGRTVIHTKKKKYTVLRCVSCSAKLNRAKLTMKGVRKMTKTGKRHGRPYSDLCSKCMRIKLKEIARK